MRKVTQVHVHSEITRLLDDNTDMLCLQRVTYAHPNGTLEPGVRFIRRDIETGHMRAQRGQANCLSVSLIKELAALAEQAWQL